MIDDWLDTTLFAFLLNILFVGLALRLAVGLVAVYMLLPDTTGSMIYVLERFSELMVGMV